MNHPRRLERLRERLEGPFLVTHLPNLRYLSGFAGSSGYLLVSEERTVLVTDGRYGEVAGRVVEALPGVELEVYQGSLWPVLGKLLDGMEEVGLEAGAVTWEFVRHVSEETPAEPIPATGVVEELRASKDEEEIETLRRAAAAGDHAFSRLEELVEDAATESDLGWALQGAMRERGGDRANWEPIVAVGANASLPHHRAGSARLDEGLLLLDYGCVVEGYHSDMSRTIWRGEEGSDEWSAVHEAVLEAQRAAIELVAPGVPCREVDAAARRVLEERGLADHFLHSTGHGVGLEIHEAPRVGSTSSEELESGWVITVEPGVYLPGRGGVRIEDMVVVREEGPELLTGSPRELT